ncbi:MAG: methyltransferase domain-containing protein [Candidatus Helarchaeota archaeon]|nr:methyltransferase domain-containing protein [Candidatus Helarchaeota archaeon]
MNSIKKKFDIISKYNQTAKHYDKRYNSIQNLKFNSIFKKMKEFKTNIVLDLGCGTGLLFDLIKNNTNLLVGMDISKKMLNIALKREKNNNLHLVCADADFLPFRKNIFSTIFSITVLQNLPNPVFSINEVSRVCKNGGLTIFTILKKGLELKKFENMFKKTNLKEIFTWNMQETEDYATIRKKI